MPTITMELSPESIANGVKELKEYANSGGKKMQQLMEKLAVIGLSTARIKFQEGAVGENEAPEVYVERTEKGFKIVARGGDVYIIEFGAGNAAGNHPDAANAPVDTSPGSLSRRNTGEYAYYGSWHYHGEKYTEIPAAMPMYHAAREMERNIRKIAKEVFK